MKQLLFNIHLQVKKHFFTIQMVKLGVQKTKTKKKLLALFSVVAVLKSKQYSHVQQIFS